MADRESSSRNKPGSEHASTFDYAGETNHIDPTRVFRVPSPTLSEEADDRSLEEEFQTLSINSKSTTLTIGSTVKLEAKPNTPDRPLDLSHLATLALYFPTFKIRQFSILVHHQPPTSNSLQRLQGRITRRKEWLWSESRQRLRLRTSI